MSLLCLVKKLPWTCFHPKEALTFPFLNSFVKTKIEQWNSRSYLHVNCLWINVLIIYFRLSKNGEPFEAKILIPHMKIDANYTSSGVLIVLPASGGGFFHADLGQLQTFIIRTQLETKQKSNSEIPTVILYCFWIITDSKNHNQLLIDSISRSIRPPSSCPGSSSLLLPLHKQKVTGWIAGATPQFALHSFIVLSLNLSYKMPPA